MTLAHIPKLKSSLFLIKARPFSLLAHLSIEQKLIDNKIQCSSCGFKLQIKDSAISGFINEQILLKHPTFLNNSPEKPSKPLICERCHAIKSNKPSIPLVSIEKHLQNMDLEAFINEIYSEIKPYSLVIYLIDLSNFLSTIIPQVLAMKSLKTCKIWLVINKMDVLPEDFNISQTKSYIRNFLHNNYETNVALEDIFFVSSKSGLGFEKLISKLTPLQEKGQVRNAYIIGCTNTGKSTFINTLIAKIKPYSSETRYKKLDLDEIPTSQLPNTTLKTLIKEVPGLKYKLYDTPGIPNEMILGSLMSDLLRKNRNLVIAKKIKPERIDLLDGNVLFIGGLARIDYNNNENIEKTRLLTHVYGAYEIALHRTSLEKANEFYLKHYGGLLRPVYDEKIEKISFKKHELELRFAKNGECLDFLEIFGLGWLRFTKITKNLEEKLRISLFLPETVKFALRETLMSLQDPTKIYSKIQKMKRRNLEKNQRIKRKILTKNENS